MWLKNKRARAWRRRAITFDLVGCLILRQYVWSKSRQWIRRWLAAKDKCPATLDNGRDNTISNVLGISSLTRGSPSVEMEYILLLVLLTIKVLWPPCLEMPFLSSDWGCWIAAYRLAAIVSALLAWSSHGLLPAAGSLEGNIRSQMEANMGTYLIMKEACKRTSGLLPRFLFVIWFDSCCILLSCVQSNWCSMRYNKRGGCAYDWG